MLLAIGSLFCWVLVCDLEHILAGNKAYLGRARGTRWWDSARKLRECGSACMRQLKIESYFESMDYAYNLIGK
jgi:hypothetical protein